MMAVAVAIKTKIIRVTELSNGPRVLLSSWCTQPQVIIFTALEGMGFYPYPPGWEADALSCPGGGAQSNSRCFCSRNCVPTTRPQRRGRLAILCLLETLLLLSALRLARQGER